MFRSRPPNYVSWWETSCREPTNAISYKFLIRFYVAPLTHGSYFVYIHKVYLEWATCQPTSQPTLARKNKLRIMGQWKSERVWVGGMGLLNSRFSRVPVAVSLDASMVVDVCGYFFLLFVGSLYVKWVGRSVTHVCKNDKFHMCRSMWTDLFE